MTYRTKNLTFVFAIAAMLVALPLASSNAYGEGQGAIGGICGIGAIGDINMGTIAIGSAGTEVLTTILTTGTVNGTLIVDAEDWEGVGTKAAGTIQIIAPVVETNSVTVDGQTYIAKDTPSLDTEFQSGTANVAATSLASKITANDEDLEADSNANVVVVRATALGTAGNAITMAIGAGGTITVDSATLEGAEATSGVVHMEAEDTKYNVITKGTVTTGVTYANKANFPVEGINGVIGTEYNPVDSISLFLHISGEQVAATGSVVLASVDDGDQITVGANTYTAEDDGLTLAALEFAVEATPGNDNDSDAANLATAINLADEAQIGASSSGATVNLVADSKGLEGNSLVFSEAETTMAANPSTGTLSGGDSNLKDLPYSGSITQALVFTNECIQ